MASKLEDSGNGKAGMVPDRGSATFTEQDTSVTVLLEAEHAEEDNGDISSANGRHAQRGDHNGRGKNPDRSQNATATADPGTSMMYGGRDHGTSMSHTGDDQTTECTDSGTDAQAPGKQRSMLKCVEMGESLVAKTSDSNESSNSNHGNTSHGTYVYDEDGGLLGNVDDGDDADIDLEAARQVEDDDDLPDDAEFSLSKEVMERHFLVKFRDKIEPNHFLHELRQVGILNGEEVDRIYQKPVRRERATELLMSLEGHSNETFRHLIQALYKQGAQYEAFVLEILQKMEEIGKEKYIDVAGCFRSIKKHLMEKRRRTQVARSSATDTRKLPQTAVSPPLAHVAEESYQGSTFNLWEEVALRNLDRLRALTADEIRMLCFQEDLISSMERRTLEAEGKNLTNDMQVVKLVDVLSRGNNVTFDSFLRILHGPQMKPITKQLAAFLNEQANTAIPSRRKEVHFVDPAEKRGARSVVHITIKQPDARKLSTVIYEQRDLLLKVDLVKVFSTFHFRSPGKRTKADEIIKDADKLPDQEKRKLLLNELVEADEQDVVVFVQHLSRHRMAEYSKLKEKISEFRRQNLQTWTIIPVVTCNASPGVSLQPNSNNDILYLKETPTIECHSDARSLLDDYMTSSADDQPHTSALEKKITAFPRQEYGILDRDADIKAFSAEEWHNNGSTGIQLETVALIATNESSEAYCRQHLKFCLTPDQYDEVWKHSSTARSSLHIIIHKEGNKRKCYLVVRLHPLDPESTHQQVLHKVLMATQSLLLLFCSNEVDNSWYSGVTDRSWCGSAAGQELQIRVLFSDHGMQADATHNESSVQRAIAETLRHVYRVYAMCPLYRYQRLPVLYLWPHFMDHNTLQKDKRLRLNSISSQFELPRSATLNGRNMDIVMDEDRHRTQQIPVVTISSENRTRFHPSELCRPVSSPVKLWLHDLMEESPLTLLAATDIIDQNHSQQDGRVVCTAFPALADQICDQMSDEIGNCFQQIQGIKVWDSLTKWNEQVTVITCLSESTETAFNCLNYIAGASFPSSERMSWDAVYTMPNGRTSSHKVSRLLACARFSPKRRFVLLAFTGFTATSLRQPSGLLPSQKKLLLSAIALSNLFILDTHQPEDTIKSFGNVLGELILQLPLRNGLCLDRDLVDQDQFCGHLVILSDKAFNEEWLSTQVTVGKGNRMKIGSLVKSLFNEILDARYVPQQEKWVECIAVSEKKKPTPATIGSTPRSGRKANSESSAPKVGRNVTQNGGQVSAARLRANSVNATSLSPARGTTTTATPAKSRATSPVPPVGATSTAVTGGNDAAAGNDGHRGHDEADVASTAAAADTTEPSTEKTKPVMRKEPKGYSQGRVVQEILRGRFGIRVFPRGSTFITNLNLVLALATTEFSLSRRVQDMFTLQREQLKQRLDEVLESGDGGGEDENVTYVFGGMRKDITLSAVKFSADPSVSRELMTKIKNGLEDAFGRTSTIRQKRHIIKAVETSLNQMAKLRYDRAKTYLMKELENEEYDNAIKSVCYGLIDDFRMKWTVCGLKSREQWCKDCRYRCLLLTGHEGECDCLNESHICDQPCQKMAWVNGMQVVCGARCIEMAAHEDCETGYGEWHKCEPIDKPVQHVCREKCWMSGSRTCQLYCTLFIDHGGDHQCDLAPDEHLCRERCSLAENPVDDLDQDQHQYQPCAARHGQPNHLHLCGKVHKCIAPCSDERGICTISRQPLPGYACKHEKGSDGYRLQCHSKIVEDSEDHEYEHHCGNVHICDAVCPLCDCYCTKNYGHGGAHQIEQHGLVINQDAVLQHESQTPVIDATQLTCHQLCVTAGRGHVHRSTMQVSHRASGGKPHADLVNHDQFWASHNFQDPCTDDEKVEFHKCSAFCHDCSREDANRSTEESKDDDQNAAILNFCRHSVLHDELVGPQNDSTGYISMERDSHKSGTLPGHFFKCSHTCHGECTCLNDQQKCENRCSKVISHDGECSCEKFHRCGKECSIVKTSHREITDCKKLCIKSSEEPGHVCFCDDTECQAKCNIQNCSSVCKLGHQHQGDDHDCDQAHKCAEPCDETGRCQPQTNEEDGNEDTSLAIAVQGNKDNQSTLCCNTELSVGLREHTGPHHCRGRHLCTDTCTYCGHACLLDVNHESTVHETIHGRVKAASKLQIFSGSNNRVISISSEATCATVCQNAGRGHFHVVGQCRNQRQCNVDSVDKATVRHVQLASTTPVHVVSHSTFWQDSSYKDPYSDEQVAEFQSCHVVCSEYHQGEQNPLCDGQMWHTSYRRMPGKFVLAKLDGLSPLRRMIFHSFSHEHRCTERCVLLDAGKLCQSYCVQQEGHDCSQFCKIDCPGRGDPDHNNSYARHHCGMEHMCDHLCSNAKPGICFLQTHDNEAPFGSYPVRASANGYRLKCSVPFPIGTSIHETLQSGHTCGREHTCDKFCPLCERYCTLPYGHGGQCDTDHGVIVNFSKTIIKTLQGDTVEVTSSQQLTCSSLCDAAGPSHSHQVRCSCEGVVTNTPQPFHVHQRKFMGFSFDLTSHRVFWLRHGFQDPYARVDEKLMTSLMTSFSRCPSRCQHPANEHDSVTEDKLHCDAGLYHSQLNPADYDDADGYLQCAEDSRIPEHHYPCRHRCPQICNKKDNGESCQDPCKHPAGHQANGVFQCVCDKPVHHCGLACGNTKCTATCNEEWQSNHDTHWCHEAKCPGDCSFDKCGKECSLGHIHPGKECDCGKSHRCPKMCAKPGVCPRRAVPHSEGSHEMEEDGRCQVVLEPGIRTHGESCHCNFPHTCESQCTWCQSYCSLQHDHDLDDETHQTAHGDISTQRLREIAHEVFNCYGKALTDLCNADEPMTCSQVCQKAGLAHSHSLQPMADDMEKCVEDSGGELCATRPEGRMRHDEFWHEIKFNGPACTTEEEQQFVLCPIQWKWPPRLPERAEENNDPIFCDKGLFHDEFQTEDFKGQPGFVSTARDLERTGHHFPQSHPCPNICEMLSNETRCEEPCNEEAGHLSEQCDCGDFHRCGRDCNGRDCKESCKLSSALSHECNCGNKICSGECSHDSCENACDVEHPHSCLHDCGKEHRCYELCAKPGICQLKAAMSGSNEMEVSNRLCSIFLASEEWSHGGPHECDEKHTCDHRCPLCDCYCTKNYGHPGNHSTNHGNVLLSADQSTLLYDSNGTAISMDTNTELTCSTLCCHGGRGHSHILNITPTTRHVCLGDSTVCRVTEAGVHHTTHVNFWSEAGFDDPSVVVETDVLTRCHVMCNHHGDSDVTIYCTGDQWHDDFKDLSAFRGAGYVGNAPGRESYGHHFECLGHRCDHACTTAEHCDEECCLALGHDCTAECDPDCTGSGHPQHHPGQGQHVCSASHPCQEQCAGSSGHCQQIDIANCDQIQRRTCQKLNPPGKVSHRGIHHHNAAFQASWMTEEGDDSQHFCSAKCPMCTMTCQRLHGHNGAHSALHGPVLRAAEHPDGQNQWRVVTASGQRVPGNGQSCTTLCTLAGRGHFHLQKCLQADLCTLQGIPQSQHAKDNRSSSTHAVTHQLFWQQINFDSHCADPNKEFSKCGNRCDQATHVSDVMCQREVLHGRTYDWAVPYGSRISEKSGCVFPCQHNCTGTCKFKDNSRYCAVKCVGEAGHQDECECEVATHTCKNSCTACANDCAAPLDTTTNHIHRCNEAKVCNRSFCEFLNLETQQKCDRRCSKDHRHVAVHADIRHDCNLKHDCSNDCQLGGRCPSNSASAAACSTLTALCVAEANHRPPHHCGSRPDMHLCAARCPMCHQYCSKTIHNDEQHVISHQEFRAGSVIGTVVKSLDGDGVHLPYNCNCGDICTLAGRGHLHHVLCPDGCPYGQFREAGVQCHTIGGKHFVSHDQFWRSQHLPDPAVPDAQSAQLTDFHLCNEICHSNEPHSFCNLPVLHDNRGATPDLVKEDRGHYFPDCRQLCQKECLAHFQKCMKPKGHRSSSHACQWCGTSGASAMRPCVERCPLCTAQCKLGHRHAGLHDCDHGKIKRDLRDNAVWDMINPTFGRKRFGKVSTGSHSCQSLCRTLTPDHVHIYPRTGSGRSARVEGVSFDFRAQSDVATHDNYWRLKGFVAPPMLGANSRQRRR